jgi:outer membrane murein-binding lipoprotein Lpp
MKNLIIILVAIMLAGCSQNATASQKKYENIREKASTLAARYPRFSRHVMQQIAVTDSEVAKTDGMSENRRIHSYKLGLRILKKDEIINALIRYDKTLVKLRDAQRSYVRLQNGDKRDQAVNKLQMLNKGVTDSLVILQNAQGEKPLEIDQARIALIDAMKAVQKQ